MGLLSRRRQMQEKHDGGARPTPEAAGHVPPRTMWSDGLGRTATRSAQLLLALVLAVVVIYGLLQLRLLVIPFLIALILAAAVSPVVGVLRRWGWSPALATATAFLGIIVVLGGVVTGIVFAVRSESDELVRSAGEGWLQLQEMVANFPLPVSQGQIDEALASVVEFLTSAAAGRSALSGLSMAAEIITGAVLMAVILFFFLKDGPRIWGFLLSWFPAPAGPSWKRPDPVPWTCWAATCEGPPQWRRSTPFSSAWPCSSSRCRWHCRYRC